MTTYWDNVTFPVALKQGRNVIAYDFKKARIGLVLPETKFQYFVADNIPISRLRSVINKDNSAIQAVINAAKLAIPFIWEIEVDCKVDFETAIQKNHSI